MFVSNDFHDCSVCFNDFVMTFDRLKHVLIKTVSNLSLELFEKVDNVHRIYMRAWVGVEGGPPL